MGCIDNVKIKINVTDPFLQQRQRQIPSQFCMLIFPPTKPRKDNLSYFWSFFMNAIKHWFFVEKAIFKLIDF